MRDTISTGLLPWVDHDRAASLSRHLTTLLQGLSVQARDGATREELYKVVDDAVAGVRATIA